MGRGISALQRAGLRRRHATASWTCLLRLIRQFSSSSSQRMRVTSHLRRGRRRTQISFWLVFITKTYNAYAHEYQASQGPQKGVSRS